MRNAARILVCIAAAVLVCGLGSAQPAPKTAAACPTCCDNPQSPRILTAGHWNGTSTTPTVTQRTPDSITYSPRPGARLILHACSQHYHCRIENVQTCQGQHGSDGSACPTNLPDGSWVEIHTAYHAGPARDPLPHGLNQCDVGPVVVVGYHARVTAAPGGGTVPVHFGPPAAEWWGSSTNAEAPSCKDPAFWHFTLGCDFTVTRQQLGPLAPPDTARPLQPQDRLSHDLIHVVPRPKSR
jgi:hypothetical protein